MGGAELAGRALKAGLLGGFVLVFLGAVGMIEAFSIRNLIGDQVTLARVIMGVIPFLFAYIALRPQLKAGEYVSAPPAGALATGAGTGAIAGAFTAAFLGLIEAIGVESVRNIFVNLSQALIDTLTFDQGLGVGSLIMILGGAALGAVGAGMRLLPKQIRRPVLFGLTVTLAFALLQRIIPTALREVGVPIDWLYSSRFSGLTREGATITFLVSTAASWAWSRSRPQVRRRTQALPPEGRRVLTWVGITAMLGILFYLPQLIGPVLSNSLGTVGIFVLLGLGLNIVVGYAGLLDLGYVAFFAVGAYFLALLSGANLVTSLGETANPAYSLGLTFYAALPLVIVLSAIVGLMIGAPVLRLRGDYLAIVTLGFGEIARILIQSKALQSFVGGAQGLRDVTDAAIGGYSFRPPQHFYYLVLAIVAIAVFVSYRLADSRVGRAWSAMREDEQVAEATGVSTIKYKLLAFAMGGAVGSLGGALFAVQVGTTQPDSFLILVSITALAVIILGGMGSIPGVILGSAVLVGTPTLLSEFEEFKLLLYGAVLVGIMILRPEGLIPNVRRMRELREEELEQDAWLKAQAEAEKGAATVVVEGGADGGED